MDHYCFLPNGRLRSLFENIGCKGIDIGKHAENSKMIYEFLCINLDVDRAKFSGCYDIPLQIFASDGMVRWAIL